MNHMRAWGLLGAVGTLALAACGGKPGEDVGHGGSAVSVCAGSTTTKGVDVSHWDGSIDWASVKASGVQFAFAKATESTGLVDDTFATNWAGMKAAGVVRGAYHFFDSSADGTAQANFVLSTVGTLGADDLPIVCDFEQLNGESEATAVSRAATFLAAVTAATGKTAILYMSSEFLSGTYASLAPYTLWVADYGPSCPIEPSEWSKWTFWQYGDTGSVSGIGDQVDSDEFNGSLSALLAYAGGSGSGSGSGSSSSSSSGGGSSSGAGSSGGGSSSSSSSGGGAGGSSGGSSSSSSSSSSGGGAACASDGQCNPGDDGSGLICVSGRCVPGCNADWECPGDTTCVNGSCQ